MAKAELTLGEGETIVYEASLAPRGMLGRILGLIPRFMRNTPGSRVTITDRRTVKHLADGRELSLPHADVQQIYHNTNGGAFAVVSRPDPTVWLGWLYGRAHWRSLGLPFLEQPAQLEEAFKKVGLPVQQEWLSPKRPFLR